MGLPVASAGMYDGPTAFAAAALMAARLTKPTKVIALDSVDERNIDVFRSYSRYQGTEIVRASSADLTVPDDAACVMAQSPNEMASLKI